MKPSVPRQIAGPIADYCRENFIHPTDLFLQCLGQETRQPFLIDPEAVQGRNQRTRYLRLLCFLCSNAPRQFEKAVAEYRGHVRKLFGKTREEVESTGSSNVAERLCDTGWFVAVGMGGYSKMNRIYTVMCRMGFTPDYSQAVAWFPSDGAFRIRI
jgi:negative regulator of replication initiation